MMIVARRERPADLRSPPSRGPIATGHGLDGDHAARRSLWIGVPFAHAVLLRELPDHGAALLVDVLVATFVADTAAYAGGRMFGRHRLAPRSRRTRRSRASPSGSSAAPWASGSPGLYQDWLPGIDALVMGMCVAVLAPVGDLFESMIKRDLADQGLGHDLRPPRRPARPPRRGPVHDRRRLLPGGGVRLLAVALLLPPPLGGTIG